MTMSPPTGTTSAAALEAVVPSSRACTRCDDEQHLVESSHGFGKYRCIGCGMVVGFDLEGATAEFLIDRGSPGRYTKQVFGSRLLGLEQRLP